MRHPDKLVKTNMTKFDYRAKRLGVIGSVILLLTLAVGLPVIGTINSSNSQIQNEIQELHDEIRNDNYVVESK